MRTIQSVRQGGLPQYTLQEECIHVISHLFGILLGFAVLIYSMISRNSFYTLFSGSIFGTSLILLYTASCCYHGMPRRYRCAKQIMRIADHCSIFILIAGSSTPFTLCVLRSEDTKIGWGFTLFVWAVAALGIVLLVIDLKKFEKLSILLYLVMGFGVITQGGIIQNSIGETGFALIIAGGISYLIGLILYSLKIRWTHAVFHVLCVIGSGLHCLCICSYIL